MGFAKDARDVRDQTLPRQQRVLAWRRCLGRYAPYGLRQTLDHLRARFGSFDDPAALAAAVSALEASRAVWLAEVDRFGRHRRAAKAQGRRRVTVADVAGYRQWGWPGGVPAGGPEPGGLADRPLAPEFLAAYGMVLWDPVPVNHRRRVRRLPAARSPYAAFFGLLGCGGFGLALLALVGWALLDPPVVAGWSFAVAGVVALVFFAWRESGRVVHRPGLAAENDRVRALADAAEARWRAQRRRSFDLR
ncbi:hypothetical protein C1I95_04585 [Micromonospora craterilacus]|uniref:Uncharacterized protein n=1 Tax=Micromonospora craterilacus TaxID=1655439 RepID=A0A2W2G7M5_9ACTN|nr:hypothetical protein [Micromonospora craterilacus]PZG22874.1 hypothetical protein C1I95_04585 [Micromonospora craterilacus]